MHLQQKELFKLLILFFCSSTFGQNNTTPLVRSTTGVSGSSSVILFNNNNFVIQQSFGQSSSIGTFNNSNYEVRQGFIQPNLLSKIKDENIPINLNIVVFPNPFKETITLNFTEVQKEVVVISLYDMLGRLLIENQHKEVNTIILQLSHLPNANYILKVRSKDNYFIKKILKNN